MTQTSLLPSNSFETILRHHQLTVQRTAIRSLQVNMGRLCNQACAHCHVNASPHRQEKMDRRTMERILELVARQPAIRTVDLTGGAPELNPHFREFVSGLRALRRDVLDRCNLTVFFEPGQEETAAFLARQRVRVIASLPCYLEENVEQQRGAGVYRKSIRALQLLNRLGYGATGSGLNLDLVYNPAGAQLPGAQAVLEAAYKEHLKTHYGIEFNRLLTIANMPIKRFADQLQGAGLLQNYFQVLTQNFNPQAATRVMCREQVSIGWDGRLYDCDFNQALEMPLKQAARTIWDIHDFTSIKQDIAFDSHCFGCAAGAGSSCGGALL